MRRINRLLIVASIAASLFATSSALPDDAKQLVEDMVEACGGRDRFYELEDVEYVYTYFDSASGKMDQSLERYKFDGELSWARYRVHERSVLTESDTPVVQGFDGTTTWVTLDGKRVSDPKAIRMADFLRKTNFYWFAMMFKLLDPGIIYTNKGTQKVNGIAYQIVHVTFEDGVGDVKDTYVLYINPETKLVDQFLFTVMDFGKKEPLLMRVKYDDINGLKLPVVRMYAPSNWKAETKKKTKWVYEISDGIRFKNGFTSADFAAPAEVDQP